MNILWDLRLFSYGYHNRGIGEYCRLVAASILRTHPEVSLFAWGDRAAAPAELRDAPIVWITYRKGGWKSSVWKLPLLVSRYRIDLVHHWVTLGPLRQIGIASWTGAKTVATVHDLGVELWDTPHCRRVASEMYWYWQKKFFSRINGILANSIATLDEINRVFPALDAPRDHVLPQLSETFALATQRSPFFITLGGGVHKNCSRVVAAFEMVRRKWPEYRLLVLGSIDLKEECIGDLPDGIVHESAMDGYVTHLQMARGLIFCSLYEGLGLPPLEAMQYGCPLVLSDIAALHETCGKAARFVDPLTVESIAAGITSLIEENKVWQERSRQGAEAYRLLSADAPERCLRMYERLTGSKIRRRDDTPSLTSEAVP